MTDAAWLQWVQRALALNPDFAWDGALAAGSTAWQAEVASEHLARALRLSPRDPPSLTFQTAADLRAFVQWTVCRRVIMGGNHDARSARLFLSQLHRRRQQRVRGEIDGSQ
jgi:hypothetical protein